MTTELPYSSFLIQHKTSGNISVTDQLFKDTCKNGINVCS